MLVNMICDTIYIIIFCFIGNKMSYKNKRISNLLLNLNIKFHLFHINIYFFNFHTKKIGIFDKINNNC